MTDSQPRPQYLAETHQVENQPPPLQDYNPFLSDRALQEALRREQGAWGESALVEFGALTGSREVIELGFQANENRPVLYTHDRHGHRVDEVRFHPSYHRLMAQAFEHGLHADHWLKPGPGANVVRAAKFYLQSQVEAAHCCPVTMTAAAIPTLRQQPELAAALEPKVLARAYDPRNVPDAEKSALTVGMAMTEKQGGSDVRANTTRAHPIGVEGPAQAYELVGHKYFVSAPMCDAFLVLAQAPGGLSCFLLPRWRPDGSKNPLQLQRLKNKMGNVANASSETELRGALAWMVGEEGRGVATIIEMVAMTRYDCMVGSSAGMRQAVVQAIHHCSHRSAFGKTLAEQPLMQSVLADLAIEQEAALKLTMRLGRALDQRDSDPAEAQLLRLGTAIGKYWVCKRTPEHAYEAMECIGGSGVMEDCIMPRLFRESPVNAIWEGSGNVQCLDVLRAISKQPAVLDVLMAEIELGRGGHTELDRYTRQLQGFVDLLLTRHPDELAAGARHWVGRMALALQASLLVRYSPPAVADAFCSSRLGEGGHGALYGDLPTDIDCPAILRRAAVVTD